MTVCIKEQIRQSAKAEGIDGIAFTTPTSISQAGDKLAEALRQNYHGSMSWLSETADRRRNPLALWSETKTVIMCNINYGPEENPLSSSCNPLCGNISVYARHSDYHDLFKGKLKQLARQVLKLIGGDIKIFVDTAPVMEKPLAAAAGLGWQGKHTNLVSRRFGSWTFLGAIFTSAVIEPDPPEKNHCGSCRACLSICPTNAFPAPYILDARRCIAYLTIEYKGVIEPALRPAIGNRIYGCDDCLAVCPWNKFAQPTREAKLRAREDLVSPSLAVLADLDDTRFRTTFSRSPIKRIGRNCFIRNVLIAIGNSADHSLARIAECLTRDDSSLVRGMAIWAMKRLVPTDYFDAVRQKQAHKETHPDVLREWDQK
ncbi:MAG: tRNA epoxyqueuosine(34) reductase QueG [Alphaproteobacteria bacterium]|nr:tRNA epoxyqueuosine(34) reductase QueG [Alphaproteobacteria bacterium]